MLFIDIILIKVINDIQQDRNILFSDMKELSKICKHSLFHMLHIIFSSQQIMF